MNLEPEKSETHLLGVGFRYYTEAGTGTLKIMKLKRTCKELFLGGDCPDA